MKHDLHSTNIAAEIRKILREKSTGVLSTIEKIGSEEFPMTSITSFLLTEQGEILVLLSEQARQLRANQSVSFLVQEGGEGERVFLIGRIRALACFHPERARYNELYLKKFPNLGGPGNKWGTNYFLIEPLRVELQVWPENTPYIEEEEPTIKIRM